MRLCVLNIILSEIMERQGYTNCLESVVDHKKISKIDRCEYNAVFIIIHVRYLTKLRAYYSEFIDSCP